MAINSARVVAVQKFAEEHGKDDEKWAKVGEMADIDIYNIVKHTQSENGAIRKIARMIGSELGSDLRFHAPTQTTAQAEAERKLLEMVGRPDDAATGENPYDNPQGHAGHAPEIRPTTAREAIRGVAHGRPLDEKLQSHEGAPDEVVEAVEKKEAAPKRGTKATAGAQAGNGGKEPNH